MHILSIMRPAKRCLRPENLFWIASTILVTSATFWNFGKDFSQFSHDINIHKILLVIAFLDNQLIVFRAEISLL